MISVKNNARKKTVIRIYFTILISKILNAFHYLQKLFFYRRFYIIIMRSVYYTLILIIIKNSNLTFTLIIS